MAKLYAVSKNAKTSKGIGDEKQIFIELKWGNKIIGTLNYQMFAEQPYLEIKLPEFDEPQWIDLEKIHQLT